MECTSGWSDLLEDRDGGAASLTGASCWVDDSSRHRLYDTDIEAIKLFSFSSHSSNFKCIIEIFIKSTGEEDGRKSVGTSALCLNVQVLVGLLYLNFVIICCSISVGLALVAASASSSLVSLGVSRKQITSGASTGDGQAMLVSEWAALGTGEKSQLLYLVELPTGTKWKLSRYGYKGWSFNTRRKREGTKFS
ncbi:hypothetical protein Dimus_032019, partial [Dionaea muscipula]